MRSLLGLLNFYLIRLCNDVRASTVTGVIGVIGGCNTWSDGQDITLLIFRIIFLAKGFGVYRSTLSKLNRNKPVTAHPAIMFFLVDALSLVGLYKEVKYSLLAVSKTPR